MLQTFNTFTERRNQNEQKPLVIESSAALPSSTGCRELRSYPCDTGPPLCLSTALKSCHSTREKTFSFFPSKINKIFKSDLLESCYLFFLISCPSLLLGCCCDFSFFFLKLITHGLFQKHQVFEIKLLSAYGIKCRAT